MQHPQHQQSPQLFNIPPSQQQQQQQQPTTITTEQIQKYLDENKQLILAIMEYQNLGKLNDCAQYQAQLQKNLMYLAAIADAQPPAPAEPPQSQISTQSTIPQGPFMQHSQPAKFINQPFMQHSQPAKVINQPFMHHPPRLPLTLPHDQQSPQLQMQQSMMGAMGMRAGNIPTGFGNATHLMMDARGRQDGSETNFGDGQGKSSGQEGSGRES